MKAYQYNWRSGMYEGLSPIKRVKCDYCGEYHWEEIKIEI
jgi:hypothetical protein